MERQPGEINETAAAETALVERMLKGDEQAIKELVTVYYQNIKNWVRRIIKNDADIEEITNDVALKITEALRDPKRRCQPSAKFSTWVRQIIRNTCIDFLRGQRYRTASSLEVLKEEGWEALSKELYSKPENQVQIRESISLLQDAIRHLPKEEDREMIIMMYYWHMTLAEIAAKLDKPFTTVKTRIHYLKGKIKDYLQQRGVETKDLV